MLDILRYFVPNSLENFNHILICPSSQQAMLVDPYDGQQSLELVAKLELDLVGLILTHAHQDHCRGLEHILAVQELPVFAHPQTDYTGQINPLADQAWLNIGQQRIQCWHTPGHRFDHLCLLAEQAQFLVSGDVIFNAGVGNTRQGDPEQLAASIARLVAAMRPHTHIYPSHDYLCHNLGFTLKYDPGNELAQRLLAEQQGLTANQRLISSLGIEQQINLFLQTERPDLQLKLVNLGQQAQNAQACFVALRKLRDQW